MMNDAFITPLFQNLVKSALYQSHSTLFKLALQPSLTELYTC